MAVDGISRRKRAAMRQMIAGMIAKVSRKEEGSAEKRAVDKSVKIAVLRPT